MEIQDQTLLVLDVAGWITDREQRMHTIALAIDELFSSNNNRSTGVFFVELSVPRCTNGLKEI